MSKLSPVEKRAVYKELLRRQNAKGTHVSSLKPLPAELEMAATLRNQMFGPQRAFFDSAHRMRVGFCSRRAGKTTGLIIHYLSRMLENPTSMMLYVAQTAKAARMIMWKELREWVARYQLPFEFNETLLWMRHKRGGGTLVLVGADKADEIEKLRGTKWKVAALDEAATFGDYMESLIVEVIGPALRDENGDLILIGTAGRVKRGLFYEACEGIRKRKDGSPVWWVKKWDLTENEPLRTKNPAAVDLDLIMEEEGLSPEDPRFLREYRMVWAAGDSERMFSGFKEERNIWKGGARPQLSLPKEHNWKYLLGMDFGWNDECAITCVAYAETSSQIYALDTWSKKNAYADDVAAAVYAMRAKYGVRRYIGDVGGYGKSIQVQLARDYQIMVTPAKKQEKLAYLEFFNSAMNRGDFLIDSGQTKLVEQMMTVAWNEDRTDAGKHERDDLAFSCVYAWRYAKFSGAGKKSLPTSSKYSAAKQEAINDKAAALAHRANNEPWWNGPVSTGTNAVSNNTSSEWRRLLQGR